MKFRKLTAAACAAVAIVALASGCASNQATATNSVHAKDAKTQKITVGIDVPFHPIYDYLEAESKTIFAGTGYDVDFTVLDATTQVPSFGRGDLDVITTVPSFMPTIKTQYGIDTTYFFPMARWTPGPQLLVPADSPVTSIDDLKGKKVAIAPLSSRFGAEQAAVLAATGQTITDYFSLSQTDAAAQELTLGRVDAAFVEAPATAPLLAEGYRPIFSVQQAFEKAFNDPAVMNGGFIASTAFVAKNPEFIAALTKATQDVWTKFQSDPDSVISVASTISGLPAAQLELVAQVLNLAETTDAQKAVTAQDVATWTSIYPLLKESGFIQDAPQNPASLFMITATGK